MTSAVRFSLGAVRVAVGPRTRAFQRPRLNVEYISSLRQLPRLLDDLENFRNFPGGAADEDILGIRQNARGYLPR